MTHTVVTHTVVTHTVVNAVAQISESLSSILGNVPKGGNAGQCGGCVRILLVMPTLFSTALTSFHLSVIKIRSPNFSVL